ncbi:four helix bundle protein [Rhizobium sp. Leaf341]|uniref:four helix bundle protein n=1 Tax=Rhizobium sp. Leaf341 TaxID=1736344 RepID=UPI0009EAF197
MSSSGTGFGFVSRIRRSAASVAAEISGRYSREWGSSVHHLTIAQGSSRERKAHRIRSVRVGMIDADRLTTSLEDATDIGKMSRVLIGVLRDGRYQRDV